MADVFNLAGDGYISFDAHWIPLAEGHNFHNSTSRILSSTLLGTNKLAKLRGCVS